MSTFEVRRWDGVRFKIQADGFHLERDRSLKFYKSDFAFLTVLLTLKQEDWRGIEQVFS